MYVYTYPNVNIQAHSNICTKISQSNPWLLQTQILYVLHIQI